MTFPFERQQKVLGSCVEVPWYDTISCLNGSRMVSGMYSIYLLFFYWKFTKYAANLYSIFASWSFDSKDPGMFYESSMEKGYA